jgi:5'-3' exonuclease
LLQLEPLGIIQLDDFIKDIMIATGSKEYLGFFGGTEGRNFRKDIAVTKEYKGNRAKEKPEWFEFWSPIFKKRMKEYWGFQACENIEADDACCIAANKYRGKYKKVFIASPDKDLFQIPETWFYNYDKRSTVFCNTEVAKQLLAMQLILGDSTDNIPALPGAGKKAAAAFVEEAVKNEDVDLLVQVKEYYATWFQETLRDKDYKKQQKAYLDQYKIDNEIKVLRAPAKSEALKEFKFDDSNVMTDEQVEEYYQEQYALLKLLDTEEEGEVFEFICDAPTVDKTIDWSEVMVFEDELDNMQEEDDIAFEEYL